MNRLIIWNVGQGQWLTYIKNNRCYHMDSGGEFNPTKKVWALCSGFKNYLYFSHSDKDHTNFFKRFKYKINNYCVASASRNIIRKLKLKKSELCEDKPNSPIQIIYNPKWQADIKTNRLSQVYLIENIILNPGDSLKLDEQIWSNNHKLNKVQFLILGHHGSLTSTSRYLIERLPMLKATFVSARKKRYGHPHGRIHIRMKVNKTPIIQTEVWGDIIIIL